MDIGAGLGHTIEMSYRWKKSHAIFKSSISSHAKWLDPSRIKHICGEAPGIYQELNGFKAPPL